MLKRKRPRLRSRKRALNTLRKVTNKTSDPKLAEQLLKVLSLVPAIDQLSFSKAILKSVMPDIDVELFDTVLGELITGGVLELDRYGLVSFSPSYQWLKEFIENKLLTPDEKMEICAKLIEGLWIAREELPALFFLPPSQIREEEAALEMAMVTLTLRYMEDGGSDEKVIRKGLEAGYSFISSPSISTSIREIINVAFISLELARRLKDPATELDVIKIISSYMDESGLENDIVKKLVKRAEELVAEIESSTPEAADVARFCYCVIASKAASRFADRGLDYLASVRKNVLSRIQNEEYRIRAEIALSFPEVELLTWVGKFEAAKEKCRARLKLIDELRNLSVLDERAYNDLVNLTESELRKICLITGDLEEYRRHLEQCFALERDEVAKARLRVENAGFLLSLGGEENAKKALDMLENAFKIFLQRDMQNDIPLTNSFMSLAYLILNEDEKALEKATAAFVIASKRLRFIPYRTMTRITIPLTLSCLITAYTCLVTNNISNGIARSDWLRELRTIFKKPPDMPLWLYASITLSDVTMGIFREIGDVNELTALLVSSIGLNMYNSINFERLIKTFEDVERNLEKACPYKARLLDACLKSLKDKGCLDDEFLRQQFVKVLAVFV